MQVEPAPGPETFSRQNLPERDSELTYASPTDNHADVVELHYLESHGVSVGALPDPQAASGVSTVAQPADP
jgi:hypothetical protein